ncbi:P-loop containing nucleoside triphosphate hydrolase protein [Rhizoclosmatium globosum]|uniref:RNA helicase n=1 Tax=Rhizoclosmatium globosum TaxID=329046 RepID=A0A1Y2CDJ2_9FUNG|nr:P-loop containing nucleoside triphosphate hydrolase protein [Rhizoclosmatium globosum]|eukprot:ORY45130.1 P-loop containing nucleoside triphosphate hydrolase protein [Rhizoclosmatium globosum]
MGPNRQPRGKKKGGSSKPTKGRRDNERKAKEDPTDKKAKRAERDAKRKNFQAKLDKLKEGLPRLQLDRNTINRLAHILDKYEKAKRQFGWTSKKKKRRRRRRAELELLARLDQMDYYDDFDDNDAKLLARLNLIDLDDDSDSDDSEDDSDDDSEDEDSLDAEVVQDFMENMDSDEDYDYEDEEEEHEGDAFGNEDDYPEPPSELTESTLSASASEGVAFKDLMWLQSLGYPQSRAVAALKATQSPVQALRHIYSQALKYEPSVHAIHTLLVFGQTRDGMHMMRAEEASVLESMFGQDFEIVNDTLWYIYLTAAIPASFLSKYTTKKLGEESLYPYEAPVVVFQDETGRLPTRYSVALSMAMQAKTREWIGSSMVFELVSWLQDPDEVADILSNPPRDYLKMVEDDGSLSRVSSAPVVKKDVGGSRSSGPVPKYHELKNGVGVAVTLKQDQGTGRTVNGFVQEVLTNGNHPRGIKVRMKDANDRQTALQDSKSSGKSVQKNVLLKSRSSLDSTMTSRSPSPTRVVASIQRASKTFKSRIPEAQLGKANQEVLDAFKKQQNTAAYGLPAFALRETVLKAVRENRVTIISGETGCGKSTQVPQFILDDAILSSRGAVTKILVTQPRRISALGLADRVSSERGESVGASVGYHIRLEHKMTDATKILFCTTGILLRRLEENPADGDTSGIDDVSHIIVDEVHERSLDSDFLLMVLKDLLNVRKDLKIVLMSATLNAALFADYYGGAPTVHIPGRTFPVHALYLEDVLAKVKYMPIDKDLVRKNGFPKKVEEKGKENGSGRGKPVEFKGRGGAKILYEEDRDDFNSDLELQESGAKSFLAMDPNKIQYPLIEILVAGIVDKLLGGSARATVPGAAPPPSPGHDANRGGRGGFRGGRGGRGGGRGGFATSQGHQQQPSGDLYYSGTNTSGEQAPNRGVLIFLPGFAEIATLHELLLQNPKIRAGLRMESFGFQSTTDGAIKVVIATNVAETSITIDDVVFVIDAGKMKQTQFDAMKGMASLEECWVSQANATQRRGRAGRVQEGTSPEIHRTPLEQICLRIKILPFLNGPIARVLSKVVEPPQPSAVQAAIASLRVLQALTKNEELTPLGFHLGRLPVDVRIGKLILFGSIFGCLDSVLTIASAMSVKSPFVAPFEKRHLADRKKLEFATGLSDHLTLLTAYNNWIAARRDGFPAERAFLYDNFLSGKTLTMIASVKRQLAEMLSDIGFVQVPIRAKEMERRGGRMSDGVADALGEIGAGRRGDDQELIKGILVTALYPNVIKIEAPRSGGGGGKEPSAQALKLTVKGGDPVFIHPTLWYNWKVGRYPSQFLMFHEKVKTSKVYIRDCSCVSPFALAFFGGKLTWDKRQRLLNLDDGWIRFAAVHKEAAIIEATRTAFDELLQMKIESPELDVSTTDLVKEIVQLVTRKGV